MKKNFFLTVFSLALLADLIGIVLEEKTLQLFSKPLIVLALLLHFLMTRYTIKGNLPYWIILALLFSLGGDILLLFDADPDYFLAGLSSFMAAHIFYIVFFNKVRLRENTRPRLILFVVVVIYYTSLLLLLISHLGDMKLPVIIYGIVISTMFLLALHMYFIRNRVAGQLMMLGAAFFVLSDSMLAINKFYVGFPMAGLFIMITYASAQFCIVQGASKYLSAKEK